MTTVHLLAALLIAAAPSTDDIAPAAPRMRAMTLEQALGYAREHQPSIQAAKARVEAALAQRAVPRALWYPRLGATAQLLGASASNTTASYLAAPGVDLPRIGGTKVQTDLGTYQSTLLAVGARQEVFDFGRIGALSAIAEAGAEAERGREREAWLDLALSVEESFLGVLAARNVLATAQSAEERARVIRETAAAGVGAGLRKPIELARAEAELSRSAVGRIRAQASVASAQALFAAVVGVPDQQLEAAGEAPASKEPSLDEAIVRAQDHDPVLAEGRSELARQVATTRAIAAEQRPDLQATATFSLRAGGAPPSSGETRSGWLPEVPNWDLGLLFSWPLYDQAVRAREAVSAQLEDVRRSELAALEQRLGARVQQLYLDLQAARQALPALESAVAAAKANYDQANARFQAGLGTSVELAEGQQLLAEAEVQLALGRFDCSRARARLGRAMAEEL